MARPKFQMSQILEQAQEVAQGIKEQEQKTRKKEMIPIDLIDFNPDNDFRSEDTDSDIRELAENIKKNGLYHDVLVCKQENGRYLMISGERRTRAVRLNGDTTIPATVEEGLSKDDMLLQLFGANLEVRPFSTEQRVAYIRSLQSKLTDASRADIKGMVSRALNVDERQARKLISVSTELIPELSRFLYDDALTINDAASYSTLPEDVQSVIAEILDDTMREGKDRALIRDNITAYARKVKAFYSSNKKEYSRLSVEKQKCENALAAAQRDMESDDEDTRAAAEITVKKQNNNLENIRLTEQELEQKRKKRIGVLSAELKETCAGTLPGTQEEKRRPIKTVVRSLETAVRNAEPELDAEELQILRTAIQEIRNRRGL